MSNTTYVISRYVCHDDLISDIIIAETCHADGGQVAHAEVLIPGGTIIGAFAEGGVQERPLNYDGGLKADGGHIKFEALVAIPTDEATLAAFIHYMRSPEVLKEPYDYLGLGDFVQGFEWHKGHKVFCSALVTDAKRWVKIYKHPLPIPAHRVSPIMAEQMDLARDDAFIVSRDSDIFRAYIAKAA
jgi:hypothetical protein